MSAEILPLKEVHEDTSAADAALVRCHGLLTDVIIIGTGRDNFEFFGSSDNLGEADVLWRLERAKHLLMESVDD